MVTVLMSTYNGEKYLRQQIDSILKQENVNVNLFVRDDGSTDNTINILKEYQDKGLLTFYVSENVGPAHSFMQLIYDAPESDYYAFSDQDDYWESNKLSVAVQNLNGKEDTPALFFSRTTLADENLKPFGSIEINPLLSFGESLVYEFIAGCTIVMNNTLRNVLTKYTPQYLPMHDTWVYSVALAIGGIVVFDKQSHILYRQHGHNTIGQGQGSLHEWKRRLSRISNNEQSRFRRACEIKNGFHDMIIPENTKVLDAFIEAKDSFKKRIQLLFNNAFSCSKPSTSLMFKIALLFNTY